MSELEVVLGAAVPLIGAAVGAYGAGVVSRVEDAAVDATVSVGKQLLDRIRHRATQPAAFEEAVADLVQSPQDPDALGALRLQVRKVLTQDPELVADMAAMLAVRSALIASGARSVAVGGDNSGNISTGDGSPIVEGQ